ncbi:MAG: branched-chain amino acid ABC transporter permease [Acidimicrobiales bacterium]
MATTPRAESTTPAPITSAERGGSRRPRPFRNGRDSNWRRATRWLLIAGAAVAAAIAPSQLNSYQLFIATLIGVYAISALGFSLLVNWTGQLGVAHAAFMGLGAYGSAIMVDRGLPFVLALVLAIVGTAIAGSLLAFPAVRLRGFFLAVATLAIGDLIVRSFSQFDGLTGGGAGMAVPLIRIGGWGQSESVYAMTMCSLFVIYALSARMLRGRFGEILLTVRHLGPTADTLGISTLRYQMLAFGWSAAIGALAGVLFAQLQTYLTPSAFGFGFLVLLLVMMIIGGASIVGSLIGAAFVVILLEWLQALALYQRFAYATTLIVVIVVLPGGLASLPTQLKRLRLDRLIHPLTMWRQLTISGDDDVD